jgi:tetratricopeptide (TPR) repeat protein
MKNFKKLRNFATVGLVLSSVACGGGSGGKRQVKDPSKLKDKSGNVVSKAAAASYKAAMDAFVAQDAKGTWAAATCKSVASKFLNASKEQESAGGRALPEAHYNAGLSYQRCGDDENAKAQFKEALSVDKNFHRPRAQLALYKYKETGNLDEAVSELDQIIRDAKFQNVEGLVALAALEMQRNGSTGGPGCNNDLACAQLNLQRALALNDSFMPAFNQLALYYLEQARGESGTGGHDELVVAGTKKKRVNKQRLDLAALVASQAQKKNPNYAPIHNTTGLILVELENYNGAVKAFGRARKLNPKLFEAQMNYAAVNLSFRGFGEAADAYRKALQLRPDTYEAHLGLALALRGMISDTNYEKNVKEAQKHLDAAKKLEPKRAEAFYNEAILTEEYRAKRAATDEAKIAEFDKAVAMYKSFIDNAGSKSVYQDAVKVSKDRIQDIEDIKKFMKESAELERQNKIEMEKLKKAEEEAKKQAEADKKAEEEAAKKAAEPADKAKAPAK